MAEIYELSASELAAKLRAREITSEEAVKAHLDRIEKLDGVINAYLHVNADEALEVAREVDQIRAAGGAEAEALHPLAGVPIAIKDLIVTKGQPTTAASRMLEGWMSPYDATVIAKIREAKLPMLGKTNLDEFAMGQSTEHSAFGPTRNPWNLDRIPGVLPVVRSPHWPHSRRPWHWAPTPAGPSASLLPSPAPSA